MVQTFLNIALAPITTEAINKMFKKSEVTEELQTFLIESFVYFSSLVKEILNDEKWQPLSQAPLGFDQSELKIEKKVKKLEFRFVED